MASPLIAFNICTRQLRPLARVAVPPLPFVAFLGLPIRQRRNLSGDSF